MSGQFSAQDSAIGYLYQIKYALWLLLKEGMDDNLIEMFIEGLDDVDIRKEEKLLQLSQLKHHKKKDYLSNSSADLWKTLRIWCDAFKKGKIELDRVILTIITTGIAKEGSIAHKLRPSIHGCRNVAEALNQLIKVTIESDSDKNQPAYKMFMSLSQEDQHKLLERVYVIDASPNIIDLRNKIINLLTYSADRQYVEAAYERINGWWQDVVIGHLYNSSIDCIKHEMLQNAVINICAQYNNRSLPINFPVPLKISELELEKGQRIFIEQLKLINIKQVRISHAVSDFYTASKQRSQWVRELLIAVKDLEDYDNKLYYEWDRFFAIMWEELEELEESVLDKMIVAKGREFYNEIMKMKFDVGSRSVEEFITRGSYHILANQLRVGWHFKFKDLLHCFVSQEGEIVL